MPGCTNSLATNYLAVYTIDDGSCEVPVYGCTVADGMLNYDSAATALGETNPCRAVHLGCVDSLASSYAPSANTDDGSCVYDVYGCTDENALNYYSAATVDQGCVIAVEGCMTSGA